MFFLNTVRLLVCALLWGFSAPQASAVIVAGTSGAGNNNSTQAGLDAYLAFASYAEFSYWNNLVRVSNASGVYLGYNATTMRGWVLSANHISPTPTTIAVAGNVYSVTGSGSQIGSSDLKLYEIGGGGSDPALPSLPTVQLAGIAAATNDFLLMTGRGFTNSTTSPYTWLDPGTNDAYGMRWATNSVEGTALVNIGTVPAPNVQPYVYVDFDAAGDPGVTAYDGQGSLGDSGGGMFIYRAGEWQLSGIAHFVDDGPDFLEAIATGDNIVDPSQPSDFTAYSDILIHASAINAVTGTLIPEPSVISLIGLALGILTLCRHRRH